MAVQFAGALPNSPRLRHDLMLQMQVAAGPRPGQQQHAAPRLHVQADAPEQDRERKVVALARAVLEAHLKTLQVCSAGQQGEV